MTLTPAERLAARHRLLVVTVLGFASGQSMTATGHALQAWLMADGVDFATIGCLSLLALPCAFKCL